MHTAVRTYNNWVFHGMLLVYCMKLFKVQITYVLSSVVIQGIVKEAGLKDDFADTAIVTFVDNAIMTSVDVVFRKG